MKKITVILLIIFFANIKLSASVYADWTNIDYPGIQTMFTNGTPHLNSSGKIQTNYTNDSFFALGLYDYDGRYMQQIKDAGFNFVNQGDWSISWGNPLSTFINVLSPYGIKILPYLGEMVRAAISSGDWTAFDDFIRTYRNNTNVLAWYLTTENYSVLTTDQWLEGYNHVKFLDPNRAIMGETGKGCGQNWCDPLKVDMTNIYSYTLSFDASSPRSSLDCLANIVSDHVKRGCPMPLFIILQAFTNSRGTATAWGMMPSPEQMRGQMYTAIVRGATGLWQFVGFLRQTSGEELTGLFPETPQWDAVSIANHEIEANKRIFLSPTATDKYHIAFDRAERINIPVDTTDYPLNTMLKNTGEPGIRYLLAVNLDNWELAGKFSFEQDIIKVTSVFDNRILPLHSATREFTDNFSNYGVRLYKIEFKSDGYVDILDLRQLLSSFTDIFDYNILVGNFGK